MPGYTVPLTVNDGRFEESAGGPLLIEDPRDVEEIIDAVGLARPAGASGSGDRDMHLREYLTEHFDDRVFANARRTRNDEHSMLSPAPEIGDDGITTAPGVRRLRDCLIAHTVSRHDTRNSSIDSMPD